MNFIIIYVTHKNMEEAEKITSALLNERLIACANFFPITSQYWWKGKIEKTEEVVSLLKTRTDNWDKVKSHIGKNHPYDTPCIIKVSEVEANVDYALWVNTETE